MKTITLNKKPIAYKDFVRRSALESDYDTLITEDCVLVEDGKIRAIYLKVPGISDEIVPYLKALRYDETTRTSGLKTRSRIFGFMPRIVMRSDYCRVANIASESPKASHALEVLAQKINELYRFWNPILHAKHLELAKKVRGDYLIPGTLFTSGIINKNNFLKYHFDAGNFRKVASVMVGVKSHVTGGHLAMPEYGVALEIAHDSVTIFDGQDILHGVTPFQLQHRDGYRYTIVYYSLAKMWNCGALKDELARIRQVKLERELKRAGIQRKAQQGIETLGENVR